MSGADNHDYDGITNQDFFLHSKEFLGLKDYYIGEAGKCQLKLNQKSFFLKCVTIENRQSPFYLVNRVTLTGKNYIKYVASPLSRQYECKGGLDLSKEVL